MYKIITHNIREVVLAKHQSKEYRLNQLKTNILIFLRGPQEYIKENGTDYFEDESNFKKFREALMRL